MLDEQSYLGLRWRTCGVVECSHNLASESAFSTSEKIRLQDDSECVGWEPVQSRGIVNMDTERQEWNPHNDHQVVANGRLRLTVS